MSEILLLARLSHFRVVHEDTAPVSIRLFFERSKRLNAGRKVSDLTFSTHILHQTIPQSLQLLLPLLVSAAQTSSISLD